MAFDLAAKETGTIDSQKDGGDDQKGKSSGRSFSQVQDRCHNRIIGIALETAGFMAFKKLVRGRAALRAIAGDDDEMRRPSGPSLNESEHEEESKAVDKRVSTVSSLML